ncbi:hypothetical protein EVAR_23280_1 [Eumeta japonica]|uniref:Uncharacterized protein n=1 Tax=Eumeta variegata TaxID=151549 RepID=A0A4C1V528_EUMVA|nr:hypothetical protein EVAR_23280_1 [Eumeta japonica]
MRWVQPPRTTPTGEVEAAGGAAACAPGERGAGAGAPPASVMPAPARVARCRSESVTTVQSHDGGCIRRRLAVSVGALSEREGPTPLAAPGVASPRWPCPAPAAADVDDSRPGGDEKICVTSMCRACAVTVSNASDGGRGQSIGPVSDLGGSARRGAAAGRVTRDRCCPRKGNE